MANVIVPNNPAVSTNNIWKVIWHLTRAMKKAGWNVVAHSNGAVKTSSGTNNNDSWGNNADPLLDSYSNVTTTITGSTVTLPQATINVSSTAGFAASGTISVATSLGWENVTYTGTTGTTFTGCSGGTGQIAANYPVSSGATTVSGDVVIPWIVMRGPSTFKIPITSAPTGSPLRGETITQTATSAEGELLGYVFDTGSGTGWMVVLTRVGTFDNASAIVGSVSGASFTPNGTIVEYVREIVFSKAQAVNFNWAGHMFYICADPATESAQLFSTLAASAGCTATNPPGLGGTGNTFPALGMVVRGHASTLSSGGELLAATANGYIGSYHVVCANAIPSSGVSPDGSFYAIQNNSGTASVLAGFIFSRVDDGDPGDVDPYAFNHINSTAVSAYNQNSTTGRLSSNSYGVNQYPLYGQNIVVNTNYPIWLGYVARGCPVTARDIVSPMSSSITYSPIGNSWIPNINYPAVARQLNHPATTPPQLREAVTIFCIGTNPSGFKHIKGRARWVYAIGQGNILDTYDNKQLICVGQGTATYPAILIGPWDGTTTPAA